jgi:hypothetical protein
MNVIEPNLKVIISQIIDKFLAFFRARGLETAVVPEIFHNFPQSFQENGGITLKIRPQLLPSTIDPIHY